MRGSSRAWQLSSRHKTRVGCGGAPQRFSGLLGLGDKMKKCLLGGRGRSVVLRVGAGHVSSELLLFFFL